MATSLFVGSSLMLAGGSSSSQRAAVNPASTLVVYGQLPHLFRHVPFPPSTASAYPSSSGPGSAVRATALRIGRKVPLAESLGLEYGACQLQRENPGGQFDRLKQGEVAFQK